jgi:hypothetical protein
MTVDGASRRPARRAAQVTLICVPPRPKHQYRQARMLEFGVPFSSLLGSNHPTAQTSLVTALARDAEPGRKRPRS